MIKAIALAGATAALVIGSIAVAQTASDPNNNPNSSNNPPATSTAPNANQNGANASATDSAGSTTADTGSQANTSATGERG